MTLLAVRATQVREPADYFGNKDRWLNLQLGNAALSMCYQIIEEGIRPSPGGLIMLSPWLDLTRATSGSSPRQRTDWLTTFDSEDCRVAAIELYMGSEVSAASDPRVSPLFRMPSEGFPKQFLQVHQKF